MRPAPYPPRNTDELSAIATLVDLLDLNRVKPHLSALDRIPNHDGSVELVNEHQLPIGELKVQIKKIPDGSCRFDCPIELVAYSERVSTPFILICVDVGNRKAYWYHLSAMMAGIKECQKTFVVRFQQVVDEIGDAFPYFERWQNLCSEYLKRVSEYPKLERIVDEEIALNKLSPDDRRNFQQFIDEVNVLLDVDLQIVKHEFFADAWKLGVRIHEADSEAIGYSIYTIAIGENTPLLTHVPRASGKPRIMREDGKEIKGILAFHLEGVSAREVSIHWATRSHFGSPINAAREFVFRYLTRLLRERRLHVHGLNQSIELLMWFAQAYAHALGLNVANSYKLADLSYGVNVFLPMWYSLALPRRLAFFQKHFPAMLQNNPLPSFEQITSTMVQSEQATEAETREAIASGQRPTIYPMRTRDFSFRGIQQAIDFLMAINREEISRQDYPWRLDERVIWDSHSLARLKHNIAVMFQGAADDYADFVKGNRFERLDSPIISGEIALVVTIDPRGWHGSHLQTVSKYHLENADRSLPMMTFIDLSEESDGCHFDGERAIVRGLPRTCVRSGWTDLTHFSEPRRTQALIYDWLKEDLERRFATTLST